MQKKTQIFIYIIAIVFIILIIFSMFVFANETSSEITLEQKVSTEIDYLSSKIIGILNQFNGFSFVGYDVSSREEQSQTDATKESNENTTNEGDVATNSSSDNNKNQILAFAGKYPTHWKTIEYQIEEIYHTWNTIVTDLHSLNVNSDSILKFTNILNKATIEIKDKNKKEAMLEISGLYALLPQYAKSYKSDANWSNLLEIKSYIVIAYTYVSNENWSDAETSISKATNMFTQRLNLVNSAQNQEVSNRVYILINELSNAIKLKDKEIFFIYYSNAIDKIEQM